MDKFTASELRIIDEVEKRIYGKMKKALVSFFLDSNSSGGYSYRSLPSAPFTTGYNRVQSGLTVAGQLRKVDIGNPADGIDVVLDGNFTDGLTIVDLLGSASSYRLVNKAACVVGNNTKGFAIGTVSGCDKIEIYGLSPALPMVIQADGASQHAVQFISRAGGTSLKLQNLVMKNPGSSGVIANSASNTYTNLYINNVRVFNAIREFYIGGTSNPFATFDLIDVQDYCAYNTEWDFAQVSHCGNIYMNRCTFYLGGTTDTSQQDHAIQNTDANGLVENCIFDNVPRFCNIFSHGMTYRNCYFRFTDASEYPGFMGRTDNLAYYGTSPRFTGDPVLFDQCYFDDDTGVVGGALVNVQERISNREFRDCSFDTLRTSLYNDSRAVGFTNTLIGDLTTNGNSVNTLTAPTYSNWDADDYQNHGLCTSNWFLNKGMGFRT